MYTCVCMYSYLTGWSVWWKQTSFPVRQELICLYSFSERQSGGCIDSYLKKWKQRKPLSVSSDQTISTQISTIFFFPEASSEMRLLLQTAAHAARSIRTFTKLNPFTLKPTELFFHVMKISYQLVSQNFLLVVSSDWFSQFTALIFILIASKGRAGETCGSSKMSLFLPRLIKCRVVSPMMFVFFCPFCSQPSKE
jgi:hypothetical protein